MSNLVEKAKQFAEKAHAGAFRRYNGGPYINHPAAVAAKVASVPHNEVMLAAAWLHDVLEDCDVDVPELIDLFGLKVALYVVYLSDFGDGKNRAEKKENYALKLSGAPGPVKSIKVADVLHNLPSVVANDPEFAKLYLAEKKALLPALVGADPMLFQELESYLEQCS